MEKEILTREKIEYEYKKRYGKGMITIKIVILAILFGIAAIIIANWSSLVLFFSDIETIYFYVYIFIGVYVVAFLVFPVLLLFEVYADIKTSYKIHHNKYDIVEDILVDKKPAIKRRRGIISRPYTFYFAKFPAYQFVDGEFYSFSKYLVVNDNAMYASAGIGDTFYLVGCGSKVLLIYKTNKFELDEELNDFMKGKRS